MHTHLRMYTHLWLLLYIVKPNTRKIILGKAPSMFSLVLWERCSSIECPLNVQIQQYYRRPSHTHTIRELSHIRSTSSPPKHNMNITPYSYVVHSRYSESPSITSDFGNYIAPYCAIRHNLFFSFVQNTFWPLHYQPARHIPKTWTYKQIRICAHTHIFTNQMGFGVHDV